MIRAILFDLDDTLYLEAEFFRSGFAHVAQVLGGRGVATPGIAALLEAIHVGEGRDGVFDKAATRLGFPAAWIPELVAEFRGHSPTIALEADVRDLLVRLRSRFKLGCVTDGWADVQRRKIAALGIEPYIDAIVVCDDHGRHHWKPSAFPFHTCCERLGVSIEEAVYVGDNPERDIRGARNAGMRCIRIARPGTYYHVRVSEEAADFQVTSLADLERIIDRLVRA